MGPIFQKLQTVVLNADVAMILSQCIEGAIPLVPLQVGLGKIDGGGAGGSAHPGVDRKSTCIGKQVQHGSTRDSLTDLPA